MNILFMCVANSARSQLAEGLAKKLFPKENILSAGSNPGQLNPHAVKVMSEVSIDISNQYSKSTNDLPIETINNLDYVITLCAEEVCPLLLAPKAIKLHWPFKDPASKEKLTEEESLKRFREVRNLIEQKLIEFKNKLQK